MLCLNKTDLQLVESHIQYLRKRDRAYPGVVFGGGRGEVVRCNTRYKFYGDELVEIMVCNKAIFRDSEQAPISAASGRRKSEPDFLEFDEGAGEWFDPKNNENAERARRRARKAIFDLVACNPELDVFLTFTLSPDKINRFDYKSIIKKLNTWLDNRVRRRGLKYVFVGEFHKDGAIHFHGLVNRAAVKLVDSGVRDKNNHTVYNVKDWTLGFSTAIECYGDHINVTKYITKYITKSSERVGGRWYYSGGDLARPTFKAGAEPSRADLERLGDFTIFESDVEKIDRHFIIFSKKL